MIREDTESKLQISRKSKIASTCSTRRPYQLTRVSENAGRVSMIVAIAVLVACLLEVMFADSTQCLQVDGMHLANETQMHGCEGKRLPANFVADFLEERTRSVDPHVRS